MIQRPFTKPERYISCPACGKGAHQICHLPVGTKTAWYCDECGVHFRLHVLSAGEVDCELTGGSKEPRLITLRSVGPVTLLVRGMALLPCRGGDEGHEYFYNEHACPVNFMGEVVNVIDENGNEDPHGVFAFVSSAPWPEEKLEGLK